MSDKRNELNMGSIMQIEQAQTHLFTYSLGTNIKTINHMFSWKEQG